MSIHIWYSNTTGKWHWSIFSDGCKRTVGSEDTVSEAIKAVTVAMGAY